MGSMDSKILQDFAKLTIFVNGTKIVADLTYSPTKNKFTARLPASGLFGSVQDEELRLTADMVGRIVCQKNGTLRLDI